MGFDVNQQIDALPSVLNAAIAGNMELGQSADIVSNIMTGFRLAAEDAEQAVDVLVKTSNTANTDIPQLGEAMKYVAPVAEGLGWSIEETAAAIGKMSDAGIQGSQAGTSLRAALLALANPTGQTKTAIEELNIELLDSEGNMKPLPELMGHIASKMKGMSDAQKTQTAAQLVGSQAASGFITLLDEGEDGLASYVSELENSAGAAQDMADIQRDTLNGAFEEFKSVMSELGISIGQEFLPLFTDIVRKGTDVVEMITELDTSTVKSGLAFAGTAAAIGLTITSIGKLVIALRGLMASMGPAGWLITGLSIVGGLFAANKVQTEEAAEVNLEHARSLDEESKSLETQITRYDELKEQNKLTNDELAEFVDLQSRIALETDPSKIEEMQARYDQLQEKSGMSNDEILEFLGLNDDILQVVPESNSTLTEQGNVLLDNTDAAKAYNEQLQRELELELEMQANEASQQLADNIRDRADALEEINNIADDYIAKQVEIENKESDLAVAEAILAQERETGNKDRIAAAEEVVEQEQRNLDYLKDQGYELSGQILEQEEIINNTELQIQKGQEAYQELINYRLEQAEVTAEKGKEIEAIDEAIEKTQDLIEKAKDKHTVDGEITEEGQEQIDKYREQIKTLESTRSEVDKLKGDQDRLTGAIDDSTGSAQDLNYTMAEDIKKHLEVTGYSEADADRLNTKLSAPVQKVVSVMEKVTGSSMFRGAKKKHGGGIAGDERSTGVFESLPKLHTGDRVANLMNDLESTPLHNEIDARLLRNEMVLTEGQQANLWRMIEGNTPQGEVSDYWPEVINLLSRLVEVSEEGQDLSVVMNERVVAKIIEPYISQKQEEDRIRKSRARG